MAVVTFAYGLNMNNLNFSNLLYGDAYTGTGTNYKIDYGNGVIDSFKGTGFIYDQDGFPVGGQVTSLTETYNGGLVFKIDGIRASASMIVEAAFTDSLDDDALLTLDIFKGNDVINGSNQDDFLFAAAGNDIIRGNGGKDTILSGPGADKLYGGAGADTFVFVATFQSTLAKSGQDTIYDFVGSTRDRIDLSVIDANTKVAGNQGFSFIGSAAFHGKAGELRFEKLASDTYIYGDVNGDKKADIAIHLDDAVSMTKGYFFL